jgi:hypothetical protein
VVQTVSRELDLMGDVEADEGYGDSAVKGLAGRVWIGEEVEFSVGGDVASLFDGAAHDYNFLQQAEAFRIFAESGGGVSQWADGYKSDCAWELAGEGSDGPGCGGPDERWALRSRSGPAT